MPNEAPAAKKNKPACHLSMPLSMVQEVVDRVQELPEDESSGMAQERKPPVTLASTRRHVGSSCSEWRMPSHPLRLLSRLPQHGLVQLAPVWKSTRYLAKSTGVSRLLSKDESRCPNETKTLPTRHEAPSVANLQGT